MSGMYMCMYVVYEYTCVVYTVYVCMRGVYKLVVYACVHMIKNSD